MDSAGDISACWPTMLLMKLQDHRGATRRGHAYQDIPG